MNEQPQCRWIADADTWEIPVTRYHLRRRRDEVLARVLVAVLLFLLMVGIAVVIVILH